VSNSKRINPRTTEVDVIKSQKKNNRKHSELREKLEKKKNYREGEREVSLCQ